MKPLTETELERIKPFLEYCAERGVETGWEFDEGDWRMEKDWGGNRTAGFQLKHADRSDYNNLCSIGAKELWRKAGRFIGNVGEDRYLYELTDGGYTEARCEQDCDLAAITAALREVE